MKSWKSDAIELLKETERLMTETDIALFIKDQMDMNRAYREGDSYYFGFQEALESVLFYLSQRAKERKVKDGTVVNLCDSKTKNVYFQKFTVFAENDEPRLVGG
jgi:hypothetical protein